MKLFDLTQAYCTHVALAGDWRSYESLYPALFRHYFRFWAKRSYPNVTNSPAELLKRAQLVTRGLMRIQSRFRATGFDLEGIDFVLFVGKGCTNGHAFFDKGRWVVWIPVETYTSTSLVKVFVTHEIAHALHYRKAPALYFENKIEQRNFGRQLLTEGMATYLTRVVLGCSDNLALWGGFLSRQELRKWRKDCEASWLLLLELTRKQFSSCAKTELFQANDPSNVLRFRAGYLVGLELIKMIAARWGLSPNELIALPRKRLERFAADLLTELTD